MSVCFIVFCIFIGSLFFRDYSLPDSWVTKLSDRFSPAGYLIRLKGIDVSARSGKVTLKDFHFVDLSNPDPFASMVEAQEICVNFLLRQVTIVGARYDRLPDSYYAPENLDRNERVEATLPEIPEFRIVLERPNILGIAPKTLYGDVRITSKRAEFNNLYLIWPETNRVATLNGQCIVDLNEQYVHGYVDGLATQPYIRPLLVALDVPVSLPYFDGFTGVTELVPARCQWDVNIQNKDFDLDLLLHPTLGYYNAVRMAKADGHIHLHSFTKNNTLNYTTTVGPIDAVSTNGVPLSGSVVIGGTNGYNIVTVDAKSGLPVADILKIGGFTDDYVGREVVGKTEGQMEFRFPRAMTNNYEVLNGRGHLEIEDGQILRAKGFMGLATLMADHVPGVSYLTDRTKASCDYVIENGVLKSDNIFIEGGLFSIKMFGTFDAVKNNLDFTARVQFGEQNSWMGKILHPITWVFTKLLLEFHLSGTAAEPQWEYISVIDRVIDLNEQKLGDLQK